MDKTEPNLRLSLANFLTGKSLFRKEKLSGVRDKVLYREEFIIHLCHITMPPDIKYSLV